MVLPVIVKKFVSTIYSDEGWHKNRPHFVKNSKFLQRKITCKSNGPVVTYVIFLRSVAGALGSIWSTGVEEEKEEIRRDPESKLDISHSLKVKMTGHICFYCSREISVAVLWIRILSDPE